MNTENTNLMSLLGFIIFVAVTFLLVMWGGLFFFVQFKKRDLKKRDHFQQEVAAYQSESDDQTR